MPHRLLHLSDTHIGANGFDEDGVDAVRALRLMLESLEHITDIDAVLVTGDIADDASAEGCAQVLEAVGAFARGRGIPQIYTTGNHDRREPFTEVVGTGHLEADGNERAESTIDGPERAAVSTIRGLRLVTLDSLVEGKTYGVISDEQLAWLREILAEPAPDGTVVAFHHPPAYPRDRPWGPAVLQNIEAFAEVVAGTDVRAVLTGHLHAQLHATLRGIPVWVTPGVVTRMDLTSPPAVMRGVLGAGATIVDLGGPFDPLFTVVHACDPRAGELVYELDVH